jgi:hypothetical protein
MSRKPSNTPKPAKSDLKALAKFCKTTTFDEISLESWESCHSALDLTVPLYIAKEAALLGGDRMISFTRSVSLSQGVPPERHKTSCLVSLPAGVQDGAKLRVKGQGDQRQNTAGDLIVIVHLKS